MINSLLRSIFIFLILSGCAIADDDLRCEEYFNEFEQLIDKLNDIKTDKAYDTALVQAEIIWYQNWHASNLEAIILKDEGWESACVVLKKSLATYLNALNDPYWLRKN